jgi:hypothetical protein
VANFNEHKNKNEKIMKAKKKKRRIKKINKTTAAILVIVPSSSFLPMTGKKGPYTNYFSARYFP